MPGSAASSGSLLLGDDDATRRYLKSSSKDSKEGLLQSRYLLSVRAF